MATTTQKIESLSRLVAAGHEYHAHQLAERWDDVLSAPREWELCEDGYHYDTVEATSAEEALEIARGNVDRANYDSGEDTTGTLWIEVRVRCTITGEEGSSTITCEPEEPDCIIDGDSHDWQAPHALLGGLEDNPGVWGHGGGVVIHEVCMRCGCKRTTDTWAQRRDTGEQGLTSVEYEPGRYTVPSEEYRAARRSGLCERAALAAVAVISAMREEHYDGEASDMVRSRVPSRAVEIVEYLDRVRATVAREDEDRALRLALHHLCLAAEGEERAVAMYVAEVLS